MKSTLTYSDNVWTSSINDDQRAYKETVRRGSLSSERERLLPDDDPDGAGYCQNTARRGQGVAISLGATKVFSTWVDHMITAVALMLSFIVLSTVVFLVVLFALERVSFKNKQLAWKRMCEVKPDSPLFGIGNVSALIERNVDSSSSDNIFFFIDTPLNETAACGLESVLTMVPDKQVYIVMIPRKDPYERIKLSKYFKSIESLKTNLRYTKLKALETSFQQLFLGSVFQEYADHELSLFAAKILTVWQFGGIALSPNILMNKKDNVFQRRRGACEIDESVYYAPYQCSAFGYELIRETLREMNNTSNTSNRSGGEKRISSIINRSIDKFCKNKFNSTECKGVERVKGNIVCDDFNDSCEFIRLNDSLSKELLNAKSMKKFCPNILKLYGK